MYSVVGGAIFSQGKKLKVYYRNDGRPYSRLRLNDRITTVDVADFIYGLPIPKGFIVIPLDGNVRNTKSENLSLQEGNRDGGYNKMAERKKKKVVSLDRYTRRETDYDSVESASKSVGVNPSSISRAIKNKAYCKGRNWIWKD